MEFFAGKKPLTLGEVARLVRGGEGKIKTNLIANQEKSRKPLNFIIICGTIYKIFYFISFIKTNVKRRYKK